MKEINDKFINSNLLTPQMVEIRNYSNYSKEELREMIRTDTLPKHQREILMEAKRWFYANKNKILHDPQNSHLRKHTQEAVK